MVINSHKIEHFVDCKHKNDGLEKYFQERIRSKLCNEFIDKEVHECAKLKQINTVPKIFDVLKEAILSELYDFEKEKEWLSHEATDVAKVQ